MEYQEALQGGAVVLLFSSAFPSLRHVERPYQNPTDLVQCPIQDLLANCVMPARIVVGGVLLSTDQQLGVEQLAVIARADLVDRRGVKINEDGARDIFSASSFSENGVELAGVVEGFRVRVRTSVFLETMLEEVPSPLLVILQGREGERRTAPRRCSRAGYRPGRYGDEGSIS